MTKMKYGSIPGLDKPVSRIFYGTAVAPISSGENCDELLSGVISTGINAFDTGRVYGHAEKVLGDYFYRHGHRDEMVILTKGGHPSLPDMSSRMTRKNIREDLKTSLELLKTDYIDIYLLHRDDPSVPVSEIMNILNEFIKEGRVRTIGTSNWSLKRIIEANEYAEKAGLSKFICASPYFGLVDAVSDIWGGNCTSIAGPKNKEDRAWFENSGMPVMSYSSLAHGFLSGKLTSENYGKINEILDDFAIRGYKSDENLERLKRIERMAKDKGETIPRLALAWLLSQKVNVFPVVSTTKVDRIVDNIKALDINLTKEECSFLNLE